jgi:glucosamine-6-phosphate deaminase
VKREIEFMPVKTFVFDDAKEAVLSVAREMANWIRTKRYNRGDAVLGFHSGAPMDFLAKELIRLSGVEEKGGLPVSGVKTFEMAEFVGRSSREPGSMHHWLVQHLFSQWGARPDNVHFLEGNLPEGEIAANLEAYEAKLAGSDPIDILPIPMGASGRLGFHLPGVDPKARTAIVELDDTSRAEIAAAHPGSAGFGSDEVPRRVVALGLGTIRAAKRIRILAFGADRADAVHRALTAHEDANAPLSCLFGHKDCQLLLDPAAAKRLS